MKVRRITPFELQLLDTLLPQRFLRCLLES
jgi:hypothetical protein